MKIRSYHKELKNITAQFSKIFSDIIIDRQDVTGIKQTFQVPAVYGNRSRILKSLENRDKTMLLPLICVSMNNLSRDKSRVFAIHDGKFFQGGTNSYLKNMPLPINATYTVDVLGKYKMDVDQIISNFLVWFNPDVFIVINDPINIGHKLKIQVVYNGSCTFTHPSEIDDNTPSRVVATMSFVVKGWLFPGLDGVDYTGNIVKRINFNPSIWHGNDQIGRLQGFYAVPEFMDFDTYQNNILCGYVNMREFSDQLQITGGVTSGYWYDLSGLITGAQVGDLAVSGDLTYLTTTDGYALLLMTECGYIPGNMANLTLDGFLDYYYSSLTGELSAYNGAYG